MTDGGLDVTIAMAIEKVADIKASQIISNFSNYASADALNRLFRVPNDDDVRKCNTVNLTVKEYEVLIHSEGEIEIYL